MEYPHSEIKYLIYSFEKNNSVYFRVPKVASTSILMTFRTIDQVERCEEYNKSYFKFAFVRNPFARLASCYRHVIQKGSLKNIQEHPKLHKNMSFSEFVDVISEIKVKDMDIHFRPQYTFLPETPDFVGKIENIQSDFIELCKKIGIKNIPELRHENKTDNKSLKDYYSNSEILQKVVNCYKKDFELFGYSKELSL